MRLEWYRMGVERAKALLVTRGWPRDGNEVGVLDELE